jgi:hypothetical protein
LLTGWPTPSYRWFKAISANESHAEVDPLRDSRVTVSGGQLIVNNPDPVTDGGHYFCVARNTFGSIRSR